VRFRSGEVSCNCYTPFTLLYFHHVADCETRVTVCLWCLQTRNAIILQKIRILPSGTHTHTHTHPFNGPLSRTTRVSRYQKGKTNLDFTEARDSEWHWHQLGHMQVCILLQTDNHASTPPVHHSFFTGRMPFLPPNQQRQSTGGIRGTSLWKFVPNSGLQISIDVLSTELDNGGRSV